MKSFLFTIAALGAAANAGAALGAPLGSETQTSVRIEKILVKKAERRMYLLSGTEVYAAYPIALGRSPEGHKFFAGDGRTPEGLYYIAYKNDSSQFYRSLKISYPSADDIRTAREFGLPAGGQIMIHGQPTDRATGAAQWREADWTEGCIAVTNAEMDQIWSLVEPGTPIEIQP